VGLSVVLEGVKTIKVSISYPPLEGKGVATLGQNRQFQWFHVPSFIYPLVPAMAATLLVRDGFDVLWNDCIAEGWTIEQFYDYMDRERPDLIALETKTPVVQQHWKLIDRLKERMEESTVVLLGDHVTALPRESMERCGVDYIITGGDFDLGLLAVAHHLRDGSELPKGVWYRRDGQIENTGPFELTYDLNDLPFVDRRLTKAHTYGEKWKKREPFLYTMVGRDCPWARCSFCSWTTLYPRFRTRSPESLLDEIEMLISEYGAREVFDDTGTFPAGGWLKRFCEGMIERELNKKILFSANMRYGYLKPSLIELMRKAGFRKLKMGLESGNQATLDRIDKNVTVQQIEEESKYLSEAGIDIHLTIMVGYPWETRLDAEQTLELARRLMARGHAEMLQSTVVVPYPGTPLHRQAVENGWFRFDPTEYSRYDMSEPVLKTPDMDPEEVMKMCGGIYQSFFTPRFVWRHLSSIRSMEDLSYVVRGSKAVIGHLLDFARHGEDSD
jgi:anaerobic magnesium-protoporphyrin IX monomethyl ester cyclase